MHPIDPAVPAASSGASHSGSAPEPPPGVVAQDPPAGVDSLQWRLADAAERETLLARLASSDAGDKPADSAAGSLSAPQPLFGPSPRLREMADDPSVHKRSSGTVPASATFDAAGRGILAAATNKLVSNPELSIHWENTRSAWNQSSGFSRPLIERLNQGGIYTSDTVRPIPPGSVGPGRGVTIGTASNINGGAAEHAIANEYRAAGYSAREQHRLPAYNRRVDVVVDLPHASDPRLSKELRIESKVGYTHNGSPRVAHEVASDLRQLADNTAVRRAGFALERLGKAVRPIGLAVDAYQLGSAFHADGNRIGENTGRAASSLAGGAAGGVAGAVIGQALIPIPVVGAVVGAAIGSWIGSSIAEGAFSGLKSLF